MRPSFSKTSAVFTSLFFSLGVLVINALNGIFLLPFYLRTISQAAYGAWLGGYGITSMLGIAEGGFSTAAALKLSGSYAQKDPKALGAIAFSSFVTSTAIALLVGVIGTLISPEIPKWVHCPVGDASSLVLACKINTYAVSLMIIAYTLAAIPSVLQRTLYLGVISLVAVGAQTVVIVAFVSNHDGVIVLAYSQLASAAVYLIGNAINSFLLIETTWSILRSTFDSRIAFDTLMAARPLMLTKVASSLTSQIQVPLLANVSGPREAAKYGVVLKLSGLISVVVDRIWNSAITALMVVRSENPENYRMRGIQLMRLSTLLLIFGYGFLLVNDRVIYNMWLGRLWQPDYKTLLAVIALSAVSTLKNSVASLRISSGHFNRNALVALSECLCIFVLAEIMPRRPSAFLITLGFLVVALINLVILAARASSNGLTLKEILDNLGIFLLYALPLCGAHWLFRTLPLGENAIAATAALLVAVAGFILTDSYIIEAISTLRALLIKARKRTENL